MLGLPLVCHLSFMDAPPPGASAPPGPPVPGPARIDPQAAREAALAAREAAAAASEAAAAGLAHWAQGLAAWAQHRLQEADAREHEARWHVERSLVRERDLSNALFRVREERERLEEIHACLVAKEEELMGRESALELVPVIPPLPYPLFNSTAAASAYSPLYSPVPPSPPPSDDSDPLV